MSQLDKAERAHRAALQSLASHLCDVANGEPMDRESVAGLLLEIDGGESIDDDTLERIAGRRSDGSPILSPRVRGLVGGQPLDQARLTAPAPPVDLFAGWEGDGK